ncbi:hypothetical protein A1R12_12290 [Bacillus amyloliquefaciens]|nr:hypothetical protein A1R12_12290 [Bacillus amyloliquefaciens]
MFMMGVLCGGLIFGTAAGFVVICCDSLNYLKTLSTAAIGSGIMFPGTMSVIIFGYIGGWLVDRKGSLYVLTIGIALMSFSFLIAAFFIDATPWLMTVIIVFVFGGLSFTKTVISTIVSGSLKQKEAGALAETGFELKKVTADLGISIAGGLLSTRLLDQRLLPVNADHSAYLYSNMLILFAGIIVMSWLLTMNVYKRSQRND